MRHFARSVAGFTILVAVCIGAVFGSLFIADRWLINLTAPRTASPGLDLASRNRTIRTLDLYPWTGFQLQDNFQHRGNELWDQEGKFDLSTGPLGFFDLDVLHPTAKGPCVRRVALIGGSGAQGWGATSNANTMARRLQVHLAENPELAGLKVEVLNFAMGGSITYQNFATLNLYGHAFGPDMVVSYSGRNDFSVAEDNWNDGYYQFNELMALSETVRRSEGTGLVAWLSDTFPNLMERTGLGVSLRVLNDYGRLSVVAPRQYAHRLGFDTMSPTEFLERVVVGRQVAALRSIKRDFAGIPIALVWQAILPQEAAISRFSKSIGADFYERNFDNVQRGLNGYLNNDWLFIDGHDYMKKFPDENSGTHLGNAGQDRMAKLIAVQISPWLLRTRGDCSR